MRLRTLFLLGGAAILLNIVPVASAHPDRAGTPDKATDANGDATGTPGQGTPGQGTDGHDNGTDTHGRGTDSHNGTGGRDADRRGHGAPEVEIPMGPALRLPEAVRLEGGVIPTRSPCPHPVTQTVAGTGTQGGPDFPAAWASHYGTGFGDMTANRFFASTIHFKWPSPDRVCCELIGATLTFSVKCHDDQPENDAWAIMHNGVGVPGAGGAVWAGGCTRGAKTISWTATPAVLAQMNAEGTDPHLSFVVEDDTAVMSSSLRLTECCVVKHGGKPGDM